MNNTALIEALAEALGPALEQRKARAFGINPMAMGFKHDLADGASPIEIGYTHGPGGVLTFPGVDPMIFNAQIGAYSILSQIPTRATNYMNPTYAILTGVTDDTGSEPDGVCDDPPVAGLMKACLHTAVFGRVERSTNILELNRLGQLNDRGDPMDLRLIGSPIANAGIFGQGAFNPDNPSDLFTNEVTRKFWERNISFHRKLTLMLWQGTPDNNTGAGGYKEFPGLSVLVNTGYVDAETGSACSSVDSYVSNFNFLRVDSNGGALVAALTNMYYQVKDRATRAGLMPVRWMFAMRPQLFYEITAIWPCSYLSYRCNLTGTSATEFIDAQDAVRFRDEMRAGRYLLIDGERVEVAVDDGIEELTNTTSASVASGCFSSDIYLLPMSVIGGQASLYLEYLDYNNPSLRAALEGGNMILGRIDGAFITWPKQTNLCVQWASKIEPRLVLRTPYLAARLRNVLYCPIQHLADPFPDNPYHVDGGKTYRSGPSFFSIWQSS